MDNLRCGRQCEIINRPSYIVLFKGDDSDFEGNQSVDIVINTELDTTGMKAHFRFMDFVQDFPSIPENKTLSLVFPNAKTSEFPLGAADATLRFEDASGKFRTISNRIHIVVTNSVNEAYDNEDSQSITVTVKGTVTWDMIEGKPTIPEPITIDPALSPTSENPVQNKVVSKALYTGFTEWVCDSISEGYEFVKCEWRTETGIGTGWFADFINTPQPPYLPDGFVIYLAGEPDTVRLEYSGEVSFSIFRHLVTPTKTSQLTNDSGFLTEHQDISGKLDGAAAYEPWTASVWAQGSICSHKGRLYKLTGTIANLLVPPPSASWWTETTLQSLLAAKANASDVNAALAQKASLTDLPYRLVEPGEWEFSGSGVESGVVYTCIWSDSGGAYNLFADGVYLADYESVYDNLTEITFQSVGITATRASLPGHLCDRAGNRVVVSGDTTLTLPAAVPGYIRDFLVRLEISGSTVPTITFAAPTGETITYETDGDEFPVPDAEGTWLYSFTETAAHKFAVALKKVNTVAQGGS